ncbi:MAG: hypothetical protein IJA36_07440 [Lachnospiraceae bacterium]|nr:hypothetical protein [Lachnospiraceae bacterium]
MERKFKDMSEENILLMMDEIKKKIKREKVIKEMKVFFWHWNLNWTFGKMKENL